MASNRINASVVTVIKFHLPNRKEKEDEEEFGGKDEIRALSQLKPSSEHSSVLRKSQADQRRRNQVQRVEDLLVFLLRVQEHCGREGG
ncbi:hypothetical protein TYRP_002401 [Tyrophagus putrescentiae]|nr:hypothetical protein TYRP_002401 [Tyrophagus putrescentiae]